MKKTFSPHFDRLVRRAIREGNPQLLKDGRRVEMMAMGLVQFPERIQMFWDAGRYDDLAYFVEYLRAGVPADLKHTDIRNEVRTALEESLIHWPSAYSRFCREILTVEPDLPKLLALLARAAGHASTPAEFRHVEQAQAEVTERMRGKFTVPMPAAAPIFTATPIAKVVDAPAHGSEKPPSREGTRRVHFSRRQEQVLDHCSELGELFFNCRSDETALIKPRLSPLICAPTGAGKSMLVGNLAQRLGAHYLRVQRGDLAPQGATRMRATVFTILDALVIHERVLLHLDELDKFTVENGAPTPTSEWGASIFSDVWSLLDGALPFDT